ncbi:MAG: plasmid recombination protein [Clostridia bacterium]|nr:plasmid recombination protein [Clostridia bacterium]
MVGKGSTRHNSRKFHAKNTDPERSHLNVEYCNENIKDVYHELFDDALKNYNEKQTRSDRIIPDYYEKIRSGKQEKPFHEIIVQIGNRDDMGAVNWEGEVAKKILDEYYRSFRQRNPNLRVFSAHLHMDEATPHLHIDFVPFTTGSKRGLETRVSLKQALAAQGFLGGSKRDTEWNQWVRSEKEFLSDIMQDHGIFWNQKSTQEKHLSVEDYKLQERQRDIQKAEAKLEEVQADLRSAKKRVEVYEDWEKELGSVTRDLADEPEYQLPEPPAMMSAKKYKTTFVEPLISKLKELIRKLLSRIFEQRSYYESRLAQAESYQKRYRQMEQNYNAVKDEVERLKPYAQEDRFLRRVYGDVKITQMVNQKLQQKKDHARLYRNSGYDRDGR